MLLVFIEVEPNCAPCAMAYAIEFAYSAIDGRRRELNKQAFLDCFPGQSPMGVGMSVYRDEYNLLIRYPENLFTFTLLIRRDLENSFYLFYGHYFMDQLLI